MPDLKDRWSIDIERGPDVLFLRLHAPDAGQEDAAELAEQIWSILGQHLTYRLVLEMDDVPAIRSQFIGQLVLLHKRVHLNGGFLRVCGLSEEAQEVFRTTRLESRFPAYRDRHDAMLGRPPQKPR